jgi:16S rRNA (adenine1518-N6/adenine1519-N6)-dimethyltransferase
MPSLLGAQEIREIADRLDLYPTKKLGQNFVIDGNTCRRIVKVAEVKPHDVVLEIGPGLGSLTLALLEVASHVIAIEVDSRLAKELPETVERHGFSKEALTIINGDALEIHALPLTPNILVANLPYNISVPVLLRFLELFPSIASGVVMVQTEVAERLAAKPGNKEYGAPSAKAAWWAALHLAGQVSRSIFWPVPNVDSSLVAFTRHAPLGDEDLRERTFRLIDAAFGKRRKMLRSALGDHLDDSAIARTGIDPSLRGEVLTIHDFMALAGEVR